MDGGLVFLSPTVVLSVSVVRLVAVTTAPQATDSGEVGRGGILFQLKYAIVLRSFRQHRFLPIKNDKPKYFVFGNLAKKAHKIYRTFN